MIRIGVSGASGRMGLEIKKIILAKSDVYTLTAEFDKGAPISADKIKGLVDVIIDFSLPDNLENVMAAAQVGRVPLVVGTTGLSPEQMARLEKMSQLSPVFYSANMSLGVAVLARVLRNLKGLENFDFQIEETHHIHKKDKPSGTALLLQKNLEIGIQKKAPEPLSIRGGGIFGIHKVWAMSESEVITFEHQALNRAVFAEGAVRAAHWMYQRCKVNPASSVGRIFNVDSILEG